LKTYRDLKRVLERLTESQLECDIAIHETDTGESFLHLIEGSDYIVIVD
jgi:hypothetical protein